MMKVGQEIFVKRNNGIVETTLINVTKKGSAICNVDGKQIVVSCLNVFATKEEALKELNKKNKAKKNKENRLMKEYEDRTKEIDIILDKMHSEFDVEVRYLSRPSSVENANRLYKDIKELRENEKEQGLKSEYKVI